MLNRIFCLFGKHAEPATFTSYPLPGGALRVMRCWRCHKLLDVIYLGEHSPIGVEYKLERRLQEIPGYPKPWE